MQECWYSSTHSYLTHTELRSVGRFTLGQVVANTVYVGEWVSTREILRTVDRKVSAPAGNQTLIFQ
jgi:hypothetical protein